MHALTHYKHIARRWFINNHPLIQKWESEGVKWVLHHYDKSLQYNNPDRYNLWMIEDLVPMTMSFHNHIHNKGKQFSNETRAKLRENNARANLGKVTPDDVRKKISNSLKGRVKSELERQHISESHMGYIPTEQQRKKIGKAHMKTILCVETGVVFESYKSAAEFAGVCPTAISNAARSNLKHTAGGYHWVCNN